MAGSNDPGFDTLALHAGAAPDPATGARAVPIHLSTSFVFQNSEHAASLFNMERSGHVYSRISNPTNAVLEERIAALEGGVGAIATASGQAALHLAIATLAGAGSHIVASSALYGGSHNLLHYTLARFGITPNGSFRSFEKLRMSKYFGVQGPSLASRVSIWLMPPSMLTNSALVYVRFGLSWANVAAKLSKNAMTAKIKILLRDIIIPPTVSRCASLPARGIGQKA